MMSEDSCSEQIDYIIIFFLFKKSPQGISFLKINQMNSAFINLYRTVICQLSKKSYFLHKNLDTIVGNRLQVYRMAHELMLKYEIQMQI